MRYCWSLFVVRSSGGSYARQSASFGAASGGAVANDADIEFTGMPATTVTHVGIWDAASSGNFLWDGALSAQKTTNSGDTFKIAASDLQATLD